MRLLVTRPQPDADRQAEALRALGHDPVVEPLLGAEFLDPGDLELGDVQALAVTSRNALRALEKSGKINSMMKLPLFAVGAATACLAADLGFETVYSGSGTAQQLVPLIRENCTPGAGRIAHLAGKQLAFDLRSALEKEGYRVIQPILYATRPSEKLSAGVVEQIGTGTLDGVILMSPATAQSYIRLVRQHEIAEAAKRLSHFCLSVSIADVLAALPGARVRVADHPAQDDLLALIASEAANC